MKPKIYSILASTFFSMHLFSQVTTNVKAKTLAPATERTMATKTEQAKTNTPPPAPTDLQKGVVNIIVGDDGKDKDTYFTIFVYDDNKRMAAYYGTKTFPGGNMVFFPSGGGEYFPGNDETIPIQLEASVPTGEMKQDGGIPVPVMREAATADFRDGGSIEMNINTNGHDTWKISRFSLTLYFNNDPHSPRKITWDGFTLSQDSRRKHLEFDKNFNPIQ